MKECDSRKDYRWQEGVEFPELEEEILYSREEKFTKSNMQFPAWFKILLLVGIRNKMDSVI